jgi:integrase
MQTKLTQRAIDSAPLPKDGQDFLWDTELMGFGVRISSTGAKTFVLRYRNTEGRERRMAMSRYGVLTIDQARNQAKIKLGEVAAGRDPAQEKSQARNGITVAELCDWFLEEAEAGRLLGRKRRPIKASTLVMDRSRIETHIKPLLGTRQVRALKLPDIEKMQADIAAKRTSQPRKDGRGGTITGGPGVAGRAASTLHNIFAHAMRLGVIDANPALGVRIIASRKKERRLSNDEITLLGKTMREAIDGEHPVALAAVRFLALTGYRLSEGQGIKRDWMNVKDCFVAFPDTKSDAQARPLGSLAGKLAQSQPTIKNNPYIFPSNVGDGPYTAAEDCLARLCKRAGLVNVTPHTLRHTFGSVAGDLGFSELTIAALLGHSARSVTQGYVHIDEPLRIAVERVSAEIAQLLDAEPQIMQEAA